MQKAKDDYDEASLELEAMRDILKREDTKLKLAQRLFDAKVKRLAKSLDTGKASAVGQLERSYEAELELAEAKLRHVTVSGMVTETELRVYKALVLVKDAEIAHLRLHAAG